MKDEIKEILNKWKCYIGLTKNFTTNEYEMLRVEDIDKILDYITNLQKENKQLKDKIEKLKNYGEAVGNRRNELYDKIDKAIEYIKTCNDKKELESMFLNESYISNYGAKELLEILEAKDE